MIDESKRNLANSGRLSTMRLLMFNRFRMLMRLSMRLLPIICFTMCQILRRQFLRCGEF